MLSSTFNATAEDVLHHVHVQLVYVLLKKFQCHELESVVVVDHVVSVFLNHVDVGMPIMNHDMKNHGRGKRRCPTCSAFSILFELVTWSISGWAS